MNKSISLSTLLLTILILTSTCSCFIVVDAAERPTLVLGAANLPINGFNPLSYKLVYTEIVADAIFERLIRVRWDYEGYIPNLAEKWEVKDGGLVWVFSLIRNATWHDGAGVTADDVVYTYNLLTQYVEFQGGREDFVKKLKSVEKIDDYTVKFTFSEVVTNPETVFSNVYIVPKHIWEKLDKVTVDLTWDKLIGCGPFKYKSSEPDTIILEAYDRHFRGPPIPSRLEFKNIKDYVAKLIAGEIDAGYFTTSAASDIRQLASLANEGKAVMYQSLGTSTHMLLFNCQRPPLNFLAFRYAVAYTVNATRVIEKYFGSVALQGNQGLFNPVSYEYTYYVPKEAIYPYNKTIAKMILEKALGLKDVNGDGFYEDPAGNPIELRILATQGDAFSRDLIAQDIANELRSIGLNVKADIVSSDQFTSRYNALDWEMVIIGWYLPAAAERYGKPPVNSFSQLTTGNNAFGFSNDTYDQLYSVFTQAVQNNETERAIMLSHELQKILAVNVPGVSLYHPYVLTAVRVDKYSEWVISINYAFNYYSYIGASKFGLKGPVKFRETTGEALLRKAYIATEEEIRKLRDAVTNYLIEWGVVTPPPVTTPTTTPTTPTTTLTTPTTPVATTTPTTPPTTSPTTTPATTTPTTQPTTQITPTTQTTTPTTTTLTTAPTIQTTSLTLSPTPEAPTEISSTTIIAIVVAIVVIGALIALFARRR